MSIASSTFQIVPYPKASVVEIAGPLDSRSAETLLTALRNAITDGHTCLIGDLRNVGYTTFSGLRALLGVMQEARRRGGDLRLADVGDHTLNVLHLAGLPSLLHLYPTVDAALASYAA